MSIIKTWYIIVTDEWENRLRFNSIEEAKNSLKYLNYNEYEIRKVQIVEEGCLIGHITHIEE